jgi:hypothetical protein
MDRNKKHKLLKACIQSLIDEGMYGYKDIFDHIYPTYMGHYYTLRQTIAEVKNGY